MASPLAKPDLLQLGKTLLAKGPVKTLETPRRIRILFNHVYVADSTTALYVWEHAFYPYYYLPASAFIKGTLDHSSSDSNGSNDGTSAAAAVHVAKLTVGDKSTSRVLVFGKNVPQGRESLAGMVRVEFGAAQAWLEEDERIYVHPKDPFRRVDMVRSNRRIRVLVDGVVVAEATSAMHLYETGLPVRYYLPYTCVDAAVLRESDSSTQCPYKGVASYYHVMVKGKNGEAREYRDLVWYYRNPTHESAHVAGLLCFYNEKVDIELDGHMLERPKTNFA